jgi:hypothetical protein
MGNWIMADAPCSRLDVFVGHLTDTLDTFKVPAS